MEEGICISYTPKEADIQNIYWTHEQQQHKNKQPDLKMDTGFE